MLWLRFVTQGEPPRCTNENLRLQPWSVDDRALRSDAGTKGKARARRKREQEKQHDWQSGASRPTTWPFPRVSSTSHDSEPSSSRQRVDVSTLPTFQSRTRVRSCWSSTCPGPHSTLADRPLTARHARMMSSVSQCSICDSKLDSGLLIFIHTRMTSSILSDVSDCKL